MTLEDLREIARTEREKQQEFPQKIHVCTAAACLSQRSDKVKAGIEARIKEKGLEKSCHVKGVGCMGLCAAGPLVSVEPEGKLYQGVRPPEESSDTADIVDSLEGKSKGVDRLKLDPTLPFFKEQVKVVLENSGNIDPERIEDYISADGYEALLTALTSMTPLEVIEQVTKSGLRGRGGAGYPTGLKWSTVAKARSQNNTKFVICNADEGDPGAFMDRSVLESDPQRVLEGMAIAAYAVGASHGYIYVRAEYPLAIKRLKTAIKQAENHGLLGNNICETRFSFRIDIRLGAGAFVCGEETALINSVEGKRGTPRPRPPYPAQEGLWGAPTLINNVETYANIAPIVRKGGAWYAGIGTEKSKGTKVFALAGRVQNTGLIEVPMGIKLARHHLPVRRRHPGWTQLQSRTNRRSFGRMRAGTIPRHASRLRVTRQSRVDHGIGRTDRDGRHLLHARRRQILHGLLPDGIVWQVRALPSRHYAHAQPAGEDHLRRGGREGTRSAGRVVHGGEPDQPLRFGTDGAEPGGEHVALFPK